MQVLITVGVLNFDNMEEAHKEAHQLFLKYRDKPIHVLGVNMPYRVFNDFNEAIQTLQTFINEGVPMNIIESYCKRVGTKFSLEWQQVKLFAEFGGYVDELSVF